MAKAWEFNLIDILIGYYPSTVRRFQTGTQLNRQKNIWFINWKERIFCLSKQIAAFADDAGLLGRDTLPVNERFIKMDTTATKQEVEYYKLSWTEKENLELVTTSL